MMLSNLNLSSLPECNFEVRYVDSVLLNPCAEYQRLLRMGKVARIAANFSELTLLLWPPQFCESRRDFCFRLFG